MLYTMILVNDQGHQGRHEHCQLRDLEMHLNNAVYMSHKVINITLIRED